MPFDTYLSHISSSESVNIWKAVLNEQFPHRPWEEVVESVLSHSNGISSSPSNLNISQYSAPR